LAREPLDRDVGLHMTEWGVPVQPVVTVNGEVIYGLQEKQEIAFHHTPLSERWEEFGSPTIIGYGGAAGGAKSHTARAIAARVAFQWPGSSTIIFRKTLGEVESNHVSKIQEEVPGNLFEYRSTPMMRMKWVTGSYTYFGYLRQDEDKFRYQGPEYDVMIFEEGTHYAFETVNWLIGNRLRATVRGAIPFVLIPSNPGNIGHFWFKRWFIDKRYDPDRDEQPEDFAFVQAYLQDNQILCKRDPRYVQKLNMLPEPWRSWLRDGDFEAGAGLFFHMLDRRVHLVDAFTPPAHWPLFAGFDWGFNHPWSFGLFTSNEDGTCYKVATITGRKDRHEDIIGKIHDGCRAHHIDPARINYVACGLDTFQRRGRELGYDGPTLGEKMIEAGFTAIEANVERVRGATNLREYFHWDTDAQGDIILPPMLYYMRNAGNLEAFEVLETRVSDEKNIEDVAKTNADDFGEGGDDHYDADRYAMASRPERAISIGMDQSISAWDPEVLAHESEQLRRVKDLPLRRRGHRSHPEWGAR